MDSYRDRKNLCRLYIRFIKTNEAIEYFSKAYLIKNKTSYICNALICHTHSAFSLSILEIIDISNKSNALEVRELILSREQYYLDLIFSEDESNTFNIQQVAGSRLGSEHAEESKALMSKSRLGKTCSASTKTLMSEAKTGVNNPMFGKSHSVEAKTLMRNAKTADKNPMYGKTPSLETLKKLSEIKAKKVFVYSKDNPSTIQFEFSSYSEAAI